MDQLLIMKTAHKSFLSAFILSAAALGAASSANAQSGDIAKGTALFATHCAECHSMKEGKDKKGPSLFNTFGTKAGQRAGFSYSDAMRAGQLTWNAETLSNYIANPKKVVPGGKMKYDGLESAAERADLIAFLAVKK
jgi:cytochrome c